MSGQKDNERNNETVSVIYNQRNYSPKYFEIKKSRILLFVIGLPTITLIALVLGVIGLIHTSPFHLMDIYKQNSKAREAIAHTQELQNRAVRAEEDKTNLEKKLLEMEEQLKKAQETPVAAASAPTGPADAKCPAAPACPSNVSGTVNSIGLSTLSLFRPIQGQRDRTRPATLSLSGFKVLTGRDTINFQFNIIPNSEGKLAGHIITVMKSDFAIEVYPLAALNGTANQISYSSGEPFATQRFRPVDASFIRTRKGGNFTFTVFIFAKNGDLLHYQSVVMPVKI